MLFGVSDNMVTGDGSKKVMYVVVCEPMVVLIEGGDSLTAGTSKKVIHIYVVLCSSGYAE